MIPSLLGQRQLVIIKMWQVLIICFHSILSVLSLLLNSVGIYCLQKQTGLNHNQEILLQNLSASEIVKVSYDLISMVVYHCFTPWYDSYFVYLDIVEVCLMTALYFAFMQISAERLLCISLSTRYKQYVTVQFVKVGVCLSWMMSVIPGVVFWLRDYQCEKVKARYYVSLDIIITLIIVVTYSIFGYNLVFIRKRTICSHVGGRPNHGRLIKVSTAIFITFILFNSIPDVVFAFWGEGDIVYHSMAFLWNIGYISDPLLYIFLNKRSRKMAAKKRRDVKKGLSVIFYNEMVLLRKGAEDTGRVPNI